MTLSVFGGSAAHRLLQEIVEVRDPQASRREYGPLVKATPVSGALQFSLWYLDQRIGYLRQEVRFEVEGSLSQPGPLPDQEHRDALAVLHRIGNSPEKLEARRLV